MFHPRIVGRLVGSRGAATLKSQIGPPGNGTLKAKALEQADCLDVFRPAPHFGWLGDLAEITE
jgi:hypothetical protein